MFNAGSNPFAVLATETPGAGPSVQEIEGEEVDVDWLRLVKPNHDVHVRVADKVDLNGLPDECNLLAVANRKGLLIVGSNDVRIHRLTEIHKLLETSKETSSSIPVQILSLTSRPIWIRLAMNEERLVVATAEQIYLYKLDEVINGNTSPYHTSPSSKLLDVLPNPANNELSRLVTLLGPEGLVIADIEGCQLSSPLSGPFTCTSWSAKGKQLVVGTSSCLIQYTPAGVEKARIPSPIPSTHYPTNVQWLENDLFLVAFAELNAQPDDSLDIYIIRRQGEGITYTKFYDTNDTMGHSGRSSLFRRFAGLRNWGQSKHLDFMTSGRTSAIGVIQSGERWETLILDETARGVMPAAKDGSEDTTCLGMELDLTSDRVIKRGIVGGIELPDIPPAPIVLIYSQEGEIIAYDVQNSEAGAYPGMIAVSAAPDSTMETPVKPPSAFGSTPSAPTAFAGFGQPASTTPSGGPFGQSPAGKPSSAFGQSTFGQSTPSKPSAALGAFGQKPTTTPAFGQSGFSQTGSTSSSTPSAFGQATSSPSAFGQSGFGKATATPSTFGSTFAASSPTPAFGKSAFGQPSAFGAPAFGASAFNKPTTPTPTAFGSASTSSSAFGAAAAKPAVGFGFGTQAVGNTSQGSGTPSGGFGAFTKPSTASTSGVAGFGSGTTSTASAFGGGSAFGTTPKSTASASGFSGFGPKTTTPTPAANSPIPANDDFGLGGFADALSSSKPTVPGLEDSPPGSPVLGSTSKPPAGLEDSPPNSPPPPKPSAFAPIKPSSSAASFIQAPKAFGASTGFGAFGQAAAKSPTAFGTGTTPPAFATPAPAFGSTPKPSTGSSAFGQSSVPVGFGRSSVPVGFGQASKPAATIGNISGGFGGFAKASSSKDGTGNSSAFAGFSSGPSVFGPSASGPSAFGENASKASSSFSSLLSGSTGASAGKAETAISTSETTPAKTDEVAAAGPSSTIKPFGPLPAKPLGSATQPSASSGDSPIRPKPIHVFEVNSARIDFSKSSTANEAKIELIDDSAEEEDEIGEGGGETGPDKNAGTGEGGDKSPIKRVVQEEEPDDDVGDQPDDEGYDTEDYDEDDGEEADSEDEEDEEEEEDTSDRPLRSRRSASSVPDLPTVKEEPEGLSADESSEAEVEPEQETEDRIEKTPSPSNKPPKSPPWFAKIPSHDPPPLSPTPVVAESSTPSLLSRISVESTPPVKPLGFKHAVRTSSPLSTQPVFTAAESTTPPGTPAKTLVKEAAVASGKPVEFTKPSTEPAPVKPLFGFDSTPGVSPPSISGEGKADSKPTAGFNFFGDKTKEQKSPAFAPGPSASKPPAFSFSSDTLKTPTPALQPSTGISSSGFSFGLDKARGQLQPTAPGTGPKSSPFSLGLGRPAVPAVPSVKPVETPVIPATPTPVVEKPFSPPTRTAPPFIPAPTVSGTSMAAVLERTIKEVHHDISKVKATLDANSKYHSAINVRIPVTASNLKLHKSLPMSTLSEISKIAEELSGDLVKLRKFETEAELKLGELQSNMLKTDMKVGQAEKFLKARKDPSFARAMQVRDLSPQQAASQVRLRKIVQMAESRLDELDSIISSLKRRAERGDDSKGSQPALERVQRSVRNVDAAIRDRQQTIDDLSKRISSIRLSTPSKEPSKPVESTSSPKKVEKINLEPSAKLLEVVEASLEARLRITPRPLVRITKVQSNPKAIMIDALPIPGQSNFNVESVEKSTESKQSSPFSGMKLSLDPGNVTSSHSSRSRSVTGQHRSHTPAVKLGVVSPAASSGVSGSFSFDIPTMTSGDDATPSRKPMFSFAGYGK